MRDALAQQIEQERRVLVLLARNQSERQHIEAAGRHVLALGRLIRQKDAAAGRAPLPAAAIEST